MKKSWLNLMHIYTAAVSCGGDGVGRPEHTDGISSVLYRKKFAAVFL